jgi:folate-binding protein YgfZ
MPRRILQVTGSDRDHFLQGLVTNDIRRLGQGILYAALLTPQGKYLADFLLVGRPDRILIDVDDSLSAMLEKRLAMYRLRADVQIGDSGLNVRRGTGPAPEGALPDPRDPALGWRLYGPEGGDDGTDWDAIRVAQVIPETGIELTPDSYILESGFERLHGVDFRKGCYVGQEVTARMKHKTELRKGLAAVTVTGEATPGTPILAGEREAGTLFSRSGDRAIAWLRFDRAGEAMTAGGATVALADQPR